MPESAVLAATTAFGATRQRLIRRAPRTFLFVGCLCLGIALLLNAIQGGNFRINLGYSLLIGLCCTVTNDASRLAIAALTDRIYAARRLPVPLQSYAVAWGGIVPSALASGLLGPMFGLWLGDRLTGLDSGGLWSLDSPRSRMTLVLSILATLMSVFVLSIMERLANARTQAEAAQRLAAENQLRLLQSQLEPHMLFNTLANLRVLIGLDPAQAQAMLDRLIAWLRSTLVSSRQDSHPLSREFEHVADYLALMGMRMGPRLQVRLNLPAQLADIAVPPLLLQPLVENAIQHGLEPKIQGGQIEVSAERVASGLRMTVRDTGVGLAAGAGRAGTSFGLQQVRSRLSTLYGTRARLDLGDAEDGRGGAQAVLELPL